MLSPHLSSISGFAHRQISKFIGHKRTPPPLKLFIIFATQHPPSHRSSQHVVVVVVVVVAVVVFRLFPFKRWFSISAWATGHYVPVGPFSRFHKDGDGDYYQQLLSRSVTTTASRTSTTAPLLKAEKNGDHNLVPNSEHRCRSDVPESASGTSAT